MGGQLGWPVYDHELLDCIAEEKGLTARLLEHMDERLVGWLEESVRAFCTQEGSQEGVYLKALLELLASLGKAGRCVIVGRGAAQVLPAETTLRVRVIALAPAASPRCRKPRDIPRPRPNAGSISATASACGSSITTSTAMPPTRFSMTWC